MQLFNATPLPVAIVPNAEEDRVVALLVVAATYAVEDGRLVVAEEQEPLRLVTVGPDVGDGYITKAGTSVCATGFVHAPEPGARRAIARLRVGETERAVAAFGPRVWREGLGGSLSPTSPLPFERVAMTWQNAYGGSVWRATTVLRTAAGQDAIAPEHDEAFGPNIDGVGFYPARADAIDQPLPELEDPDALIASIDDRPDPVCFAPYPMYGGLRALTAVKDGWIDYSRHGRVLSRAAPRTTFPEIAPGTPVVLEGMRPRGEVLCFGVPPAPVAAGVRAGARRRELALYTDAIDIDAEAKRVRIAYRAVFAYELIRHEIRTAKVEATELFASMLRPPKR